MKLISRKKEIFTVNTEFDRYLRSFGRGNRLDFDYDDLLCFNDSFPLYDKDGNDTLWLTIQYEPSMRRDIDRALLKIYAFLRAGGDLSMMRHLVVERVDLCLYGNTKPFRVRISNPYNDNFDTFYIKQADASRIYGLELEHILSPNRLNYFYYDGTLVEDHINGIPGDIFREHYLDAPRTNKIRLSKEFVKFNERCLIMLLGDMHASNFVVDVTLDHESDFYRIRAIDFDQQSYDGQIKVYLPQFFPENSRFVKYALDNLDKDTIKQYQKEEQSLIKTRVNLSSSRINSLLECMKKDKIAPFENVQSLRSGLADHYKDPSFEKAMSMGELVERSLIRVVESGSSL